MDIEALLSSLAPTKHWWQASLPEEARFHGHPVLLRFSTESVPSGSMPAPSGEMKALARTILTNIAPILRKAETEYADYHQSYMDDPVAVVDEPRILIDIDALLDDGPNRWALIVGHKENEDFGTHIEFEGAQFVEIWSGD